MHEKRRMLLVHTQKGFPKMGSPLFKCAECKKSYVEEDVSPFCDECGHVTGFCCIECRRKTVEHPKVARDSFEKIYRSNLQSLLDEEQTSLKKRLREGGFSESPLKRQRTSEEAKEEEVCVIEDDSESEDEEDEEEEKEVEEVEQSESESESESEGLHIVEGEDSQS